MIVVIINIIVVIYLVIVIQIGELEEPEEIPEYVPPPLKETYTFTEPDFIHP